LHARSLTEARTVASDLEQVQRKCQRAVNGIETNRALAVDSFKIKVGAA